MTETVASRRSSRAYCLFPCRSRLLAVAVDAVEGILEAARLVRFPLCPWPVAGLCTYRGRILPVVRPADDCEGWAGGRPGLRPTVLVLRTGHGHLGLLIDRDGIRIVADAEVDGGAGPVGGRAPLPPEGLVVAGTIDREGKSHAVIDPDRTWSALRSVIEGGYGAGLGVAASAVPSSDGG